MPTSLLSSSETAVIDAFDSPAWILMDLTRSLPGWLAYEQGGLAFADGWGEIIFQAPVSEIRDLKFPWYYFGGGMKLTVLDQRYRLSFVPPNGSEVKLARHLATQGSAIAGWQQGLRHHSGPADRIPLA